MEFFTNLNSVSQSLIAGIFTWGITSLGASLVLFQKKINQKHLDAMLGFAGGVMISASFWSLLLPAIDLSKSMGIPELLPLVVGFLLGAIFLFSIDKILPHLHIGFLTKEAEGIKTNWKKSTLLFLAVTLHNIPEGLAIGVAFGSVSAGLSEATLAGAISLAIGIGIQNFPEGFAISAPLRAEGFSKFKSFWYGQISAIVEPISAVIGALAVVVFRPILPYALAFAAGAMIFVVIEEVIPESQRNGNTDIATASGIFGFVVMMILDISLG